MHDFSGLSLSCSLNSLSSLSGATYYPGPGSKNSTSQSKTRKHELNLPDRESFYPLFASGATYYPIMILACYYHPYGVLL